MRLLHLKDALSGGIPTCPSLEDGRSYRLVCQQEWARLVEKLQYYEQMVYEEW